MSASDGDAAGTPAPPAMPPPWPIRPVARQVVRPVASLALFFLVHIARPDPHGPVDIAALVIAAAAAVLLFRYKLGVIPVINEGPRSASLLARMARLDIAARADVVIVDGGSTDGSLEEQTLRAAGVRGLLVKTGPGRLGAQQA